MIPIKDYKNPNTERNGVHSESQLLWWNAMKGETDGVRGFSESPSPALRSGATSEYWHEEGSRSSAGCLALGTVFSCLGENSKHEALKKVTLKSEDRRSPSTGTFPDSQSGCSGSLENATWPEQPLQVCLNTSMTQSQLQVQTFPTIRSQGEKAL